MMGLVTSRFRPAACIASLGVSEILRIGARAGELAAEGRDVIVPGAGEPDFETPRHVRAAAVAAMDAGETRNTPLQGSPALKAAYSASSPVRTGWTTPCPRPSPAPGPSRRSTTR